MFEVLKDIDDMSQVPRAALHLAQPGRVRAKLAQAIEAASPSRPQLAQTQGDAQGNTRQATEAIWQCEEVRDDALAAFMDRLGFKGW